jgi:hypothetical protein
VLIVGGVAGEPEFEERQRDESASLVDDGALDDPHELLSGEAKRQLADRRDAEASHRDLMAEVRDTNAQVRDYKAGVRDDRITEQADSTTGSSRQAAHDRAAAAGDRASAHDDREHARQDRDVARWDRDVAAQTQAHLLASLNDADDLAEATLLIGQAQGLLMSTLDLSVGNTLIELEQRAARDRVGLLDAARRIIAERPPPDR